jgi:5'-methylthioadenosine phosphorylase
VVRDRAEIGIFGGSGFYSFLESVELIQVETPFGLPSDHVAIGKVGDRNVAFIPRHGRKHSVPPAAINYRANLWALHSLGVTRVIGPNALGSLQPHIHPGDFVVSDQFIDRTSGRADTFFDRGPKVAHVSTAHPYCPVLRELTVKAGRDVGATVHERGTIVVVQGPRFSTRAESQWFTSHGWDVINMTQYPEVALARELEMCYVCLSLITDYDSGLEGHPDVKPVSVEDVERLFAANIPRLRDLILRMIPLIPAERDCLCATAMKGAVIGG